MELAGLILVGIGVNTFINGVWLILYNSQNKRIDAIQDILNQLLKNGVN